MKGFYISIKNDLLEPKHYQNMGESIWLYLWLIDKMTSISEAGVGKILGGRPVTTEDIQIELGMPIRTYRRYTSRLKKYGYVSTTRTPHGLVFTINKANKPFKRSAKNGTSAKHSDVPKMSSDVPNSVTGSAKSAHVYIDNNNTVTRQKQGNTDFLLERKEQAAKNRKPSAGYKHAASIADEIRRRGLSKK